MGSTSSSRGDARRRSWSHRGRGALGAACLAWAPLAWPQGTAPQAPPATDQADDRPGQFRLGPFFVTPSLHIGNIGVDTNVFFTSVDRTRDFTISGGPGLDVVLPVKRKLRFLVGGTLDYLYFAEQIDQRRLTGSGRGRVDFRGQRLVLGGEESYDKTFSRPSFEVDDRIEQEQWRTRGDLKILPGEGRFTLAASFTLTKIDVKEGQVYLGSDLSTTLSRDEYLSELGVGYALTPKTSFVVEGDYQQDRFKYEPQRDADSNRAAAGFKVASSSRLSGRALGGVRWFRPQAAARSDILVPYADVALVYDFGRSTRVGGSYQRDLDYSAFHTGGDTPTLRTEFLGFSLDQRMVSHVWLRLTGGLSRFQTDGPVTLDIPGQGRVTAVREDRARQGGADLGWQFPFKLRVGIGAFYTDRNSTISYFGVDGLSVGLTVTYTGTPAVTWRP